jgi:CelD/BcsL family acetyltransferase involved in cellulose biosynthesis
VAPGEGFNFAERIGENCPAIRLPATWEEYQESLEAHERRETRRRFNKAYEKGGARLVHSAAEADPVGALDKAIEILGAGAGEKAAAFQNTLKPILKAAGPPLMKAGRFDVATLYVEDIASGVLLITPGHEGPMLYNTGFDIARKEWSPGTVAVASGIREAIALHAPVFDMLRGTEPYKYRLGAVDRPLYRLTLKRT